MECIRVSRCRTSDIEDQTLKVRAHASTTTVAHQPPFNSLTLITDTITRHNARPILRPDSVDAFKICKFVVDEHHHHINSLLKVVSSRPSQNFMFAFVFFHGQKLYFVCSLINFEVSLDCLLFWETLWRTEWISYGHLQTATWIVVAGTRNKYVWFTDTRANDKWMQAPFGCLIGESVHDRNVKISERVSMRYEFLMCISTEISSNSRTRCRPN